MKIPEIYFQLVKKFKNGGSLKRNYDQFENPLDTELGTIFISKEQIYAEGAEMLTYFDVDEDYHTQHKLSDNELKYYLGGAYSLENSLCFATDGSDCPFCMDFTNCNIPEIIYWDDGVLQWRKIANTVEDFFNLFNPNE